MPPISSRRLRLRRNDACDRHPHSLAAPYSGKPSSCITLSLATPPLTARKSSNRTRDFCWVIFTLSCQPLYLASADGSTDEGRLEQNLAGVDDSSRVRSSSGSLFRQSESSPTLLPQLQARTAPPFNLSSDISSDILSPVRSADLYLTVYGLGKKRFSLRQRLAKAQLLDFLSKRLEQDFGQDWQAFQDELQVVAALLVSHPRKQVSVRQQILGARLRRTPTPAGIRDQDQNAKANSLPGRDVRACLAILQTFIQLEEEKRLQSPSPEGALIRAAPKENDPSPAEPWAQATAPLPSSSTKAATYAQPNTSATTTPSADPKASRTLPLLSLVAPQTNPRDLLRQPRTLSHSRPTPPRSLNAKTLGLFALGAGPVLYSQLASSASSGSQPSARSPLAVARNPRARQLVTNTFVRWMVLSLIDFYSPALTINGARMIYPYLWRLCWGSIQLRPDANWSERLHYRVWWYLNYLPSRARFEGLLYDSRHQIMHLVLGVLLGAELLKVYLQDPVTAPALAPLPTPGANSTLVWGA